MSIYIISCLNLVLLDVSKILGKALILRSEDAAQRGNIMRRGCMMSAEIHQYHTARYLIVELMKNFK